MPTGVVDIGSELERKEWMQEGLVQKASKSFWTSMQGNSKDSVVFQAKNGSAKAGHTVVFDFDGNISGKAVKGKEKAYGKGETKKKFSDKLTVERYRLVVDNGDKFDGVNVGDLSINEHSDSRSKLADLYIRFKDQALFDSAQGNLVTISDGAAQAPSHVIDLGTTFTYNKLLDIDATLKTSNGFTTGGVRRPLEPFMTADGEPVWLVVIDTAMKKKLMQDSTFQSVMQNADVRGNDNRLIKNVLAKIGTLLIVEAGNFFGFTEGTTTGWGLDDSEIEISGLRQYDGADPATALWTGQEGFDYASTSLHSRGLILGAGALQLGYGMQPDYKHQFSDDFQITSESALEVWMEVRKTNLTPENVEDYKQAKIANLDWGVVALDLQVQS